MHTSKTKMRVMILTEQYSIEGDIHMLPGSRLTDIINVKGRNDFMPITSAVIKDPSSNTVLFEVEFVSVNRESIVMLLPVEDMQGDQSDIMSAENMIG